MEKERICNSCMHLYEKVGCNIHLEPTGDNECNVWQSKNCINCKHENLDITLNSLNPCNKCEKQKNWEPKEIEINEHSEIEKKQKKDCTNCNFYELPMNKFPCDECHKQSQWKPIVAEKNCDNCKHDANGIDCPICKDFNKWEEKNIQLLSTEDYTKVDKFQVLQEQELELYKLKNNKYGDSFGISVKKYGLISALTRMSDKWNRIEKMILDHDNGTDDESLVDSLKDLSNYCNMTIIELEDTKCK